MSWYRDHFPAYIRSKNTIQVDKSSVMYDPHTKDSRGFGFVMMMDADGAAKAIEELSGKEFMGKIMTVAHVSPAFPIQKLIVQLLTYTRARCIGSSSSCQDSHPWKVLRTSQDW